MEESQFTHMAVGGGEYNINQGLGVRCSVMFTLSFNAIGQLQNCV